MSLADGVRISIVIATYNRRHVLAHTLPSVLEQDYPPEDYEIVLVVDGSTDGTAEYVRSFSALCGLTVLEQENNGPATARNAGIAAATGDVVLFLDDDIRCDSRLVREHAQGHAEEKGVLVHGAIFVAPESPPTLAAWSTRDWYERYNADIVEAGGLRPNEHVYLGANSSVSPEILRELGGFDESIPFPREDFELGLRMSKSGVPFRYRPDATAYEVFSKPSRAFVRSDAEGHGRAEVAICRKHPEYRSHSVLAPAGQPTPLRTAARRTVLRLPRGAENVLDPAVEVAERFIHHRRAQRVGMRLLGLQHRVVLQRSAREAVGSARSLEEEFDRWLPVLLYHRIGEGLAGMHPSLSVSPRAFERHVGWLAQRGFTGVRPSQWHAWLEGSASLPRKPILFTFDDGYSDLVKHALPVLRSHGFGAVVFVVTGRLGGTNTWDPIGPDTAPPRLMTAEEVAHWAGKGIEFGAHGRTHRDLSSLTGAELDYEVRGSREDLERIVGQPVTCFAYPFGRHHPTARERVAATYEMAFTDEAGVNGLRTPSHLLRRTAVRPDETLIDLEWRVRLGRTPLPRVRSTLRVRSRFRELTSILPSRS